MPYRKLPRWRRAILTRAPRALLEEPFEIFLALLCLLAGIPLLLGAPEPESLNRLLAPAVVKLWGIMLVIGSGAVLVGLVPRMRWVQIKGLQLLGLAALVYAIAVLALGTRGRLPGLITLAFALACLAKSFMSTTAALIARTSKGDLP